MSDKAGNTKAAKKQRFAGIKRFFGGVKTEFRKIIWPDRDTLLKQLLAVLVVTFIVGVMIALIDYGVQHLIDLLVGIQLPAASAADAASTAASTAASVADTASTAATTAASVADTAAAAVSTAASEAASTAASVLQ